MGKTNQIRRETGLIEAVHNLRGNTHFDALLTALDVECGYGKTVFDLNERQSAFNAGKQSVANTIHEALKTLDKEGNQPTNQP